MKKEDLKTGMFGMMSNGKLFVIVNDFIVYQEGGFDHIKSCDKNLYFNFYGIDKLVYSSNFDNAMKKIENGIGIIYDRKAQEETTAMTIAEIKEKLGIKNLVIKGEN